MRSARRRAEPQPLVREGKFFSIRRRLAEPESRQQAAVEAGDWARDLCLAMGAGIDTAYSVGGAFASGIAKTWEGEASAEGSQGN